MSTFGFRGEALSSLCALSNVSIITRHKNDECGTKLEFDHNGLIVKKTPCPREVGTTISLVNIFSTLPVRQKEFHKNIKREFNKMTQLLYAYCLVANHAKIMCTNQNRGYGRTIIVSTQANATLRSNIINIFGSQQNQNLIDIKPLNTYITEPTDIADVTNNKMQKSPFQIEGVISSCAHGAGRSSNDRQFYYINSRPCEPTKISKVVNEVYKQFNVNQSPFVFLNIKVEHQDVDVNVTPDKRQIFLNHEKILTALLKQALIKLFENIPSTIKLQNKSLDTSNFNQLTFTKNTLHNIEKDDVLNKKDQSSTLKRKVSFLERFAASSKQIKLCSDKKSLSYDTLNSETINGIKTPNLSSDSEEENTNIPKMPFLNLMEKISEETTDDEDKSNENDLKISPKNNPIFMPKNVNIFHEDDDKLDSLGDLNGLQSTKLIFKPKLIIDPTKEQEDINFDKTDKFKLVFNPKTIIKFEDNDKCKNIKPINEEKEISDESEQEEFGEVNDHNECDRSTQESSSSNNNMEKSGTDAKDYEQTCKSNRPRVQLKCSLEDIKERMKMQQQSKESEQKLNRIKFRSEITPSSNESAEKELDREISKEMFSKMKIIGQFNLGFIIVQLEDDLFIIDQHASDEKYNFENLQKTTILLNQKLVVPQPLELTAMNESILLDNLDVFERNGFKFEIDKDADAMKRVKLSAIPLSKNTEFGKEDIDELLFMLQDSSGDNSTCRPSRIRSMLASRACRKSVMVGSPMTRADMRKLVDNMGTMEQPWNCPHGRPTMRHLVNLYLLKKGSEQ